MIKLTTKCRGIDTLRHALPSLAVASLIGFSWGFQEDSRPAPAQANSVVEFIQSGATSPANGSEAANGSGVELIQSEPDGTQTTLAANNVPWLIAPDETRQPFVLDNGPQISGPIESPLQDLDAASPLELPADEEFGPVQEGEPEVLLRGPLHEAFANVHQADPQPNPIISGTPPETIDELPPEYKPEGENVEWIPGYWAWEPTEEDFIWVSGVWRDVPPNRRWVSGYWETVDNGNRWVSGFWAPLEQQQLNYLPAPPASIDQGPSVARPSEDYFYSPGNWEFQNDNYVWRSGYWQPRVENWIWIPSTYVWTPRGCVYRPGFWDHEFGARGTAFAPVRFAQPHFAPNFRYCPSYSINTGVNFFVHLFVRPNCRHYFYGNYYNGHVGNVAFRPWVQPQSHFRNYDPLLNHYNCRNHRIGSDLLVQWVRNQHFHYRTHRDLRPRNTFQAQIRWSQTNRRRNDIDFISRAGLAVRYDDLVRGRNPQLNRIRNQQNATQRAVRQQFVRIQQEERRRQEADRRLKREIERVRRQAEHAHRDHGKNVRPGAGRKGQSVSRGKVTIPSVQDRKRINQRTAEIKRAQRDAEKLNRKRATERKIADAKRQADQKRTQRELAKQATNRQQQQRASDRRNKNTTVRTQPRSVDPKQAQRDAERLNRKRATEQKIADAKRQANLKRTQRDLAKQNNRQQQQQRTIERRNKVEADKAARDAQRRLAEARRAKPGKSNGVVPNRNPSQPRIANNQGQRNSANQAASRRRAEELAQKQAAQRRADQQREAARSARNQQSRIKAENAKRSAQQKAEAARIARQRNEQQRMAARQQDANRKQAADRQRNLQRQRDAQARAQADAKRRADAQAKSARQQAQRDAQQRAQRQKAQADQARRAQQRAQQDARRRAEQNARKAADAAKRRQRAAEQAKRRSKRKKK